MAFPHIKNVVQTYLNRFNISSDWFGETVTYTPRGGSPRSIDVFAENEEDLDIEGVDTETREEILRVTCQKHETAGINRPNIGDTITRSAEHDEDTRPFVYQGEYDRESRDHWRLTFSRKRRDAQGLR